MKRKTRFLLPFLQECIDRLVTISRSSFEIALVEAIDAGLKQKDIAKAQTHFDKALKELAKGNFGKAIKEFGKAWKELS